MIFYAVQECIVYYAGFKILISEYVFTINCLFICSYCLFELQLVIFPLKVVYRNDVKNSTNIFHTRYNNLIYKSTKVENVFVGYTTQ